MVVMSTHDQRMSGVVMTANNVWHNLNCICPCSNKGYVNCHPSLVLKWSYDQRMLSVVIWWITAMPCHKVTESHFSISIFSPHHPTPQVNHSFISSFLVGRYHVKWKLFTLPCNCRQTTLWGCFSTRPKKESIHLFHSTLSFIFSATLL